MNPTQASQTTTQEKNIIILNDDNENKEKTTTQCKECRARPKTIKQYINYYNKLFVKLNDINFIDFLSVDLEEDKYNIKFKDEEDRKDQIIKFIINTLYEDETEDRKKYIYILTSYFMPLNKDFFIIPDKGEYKIYNLYKLISLILKGYTRTDKINLDLNFILKKESLTPQQIKEKFIMLKESKKRPYNENGECPTCCINSIETDDNIFYCCDSETTPHLNFSCLECANNINLCPLCRAPYNKYEFNNFLYKEQTRQSEGTTKNNIIIKNNKKIISSNIETTDEDFKKNVLNSDGPHFLGLDVLILDNDNKLIKLNIKFIKKFYLYNFIKCDLLNLLANYLICRSSQKSQDFYNLMSDHQSEIIPDSVQEEIINNILNPDYDGDDPDNHPLYNNIDTFKFLLGIKQPRRSKNPLSEEEEEDRIINKIINNEISFINYDDTEKTDIQNLLYDNEELFFLSPIMADNSLFISVDEETHEKIADLIDDYNIFNFLFQNIEDYSDDLDYYDDDDTKGIYNIIQKF